MADQIAKKDQIAAARKKLKQFRKDGKPANAIDGHVPVGHQHGSSPKNAQERSSEGNGPVSSNSNSLAKNVVSNSIGPSSAPARHGLMTASTESLNQLSRQLSGLVAESNAYLNGQELITNSGTEDLERRNRELASLLNQHSTLNSQLNSQLDEVKQQYAILNNTLDTERKSFEDRLKRELGTLKEQLQVHIQTIGILVAEKTELQSSLNQLQKTAETRQAEVEELSGRLKASRQRVADLERNVTSATSSSQKNEKTNKDLQKEVDKLKMDVYKLNKSNEEFQQHNLELQGKLQKKTSEATKLEDQLIELRGQLQMSELHVHQLQNGQEPSNAEHLKQIEDLIGAKSELSVKLQQREDLIANMKQENEAAVQQYTQFIAQIQLQAQQLQSQVEAVTEQRDACTFRLRELESTMAKLKERDVASTELTVQNLEEKASLTAKIEKLTAELEATSKNLEVQVADNAQLGRLVIEKENRILQLEMAVEQASDAAVDKEKLLETMQSDKTALSRAMAQNKELKNQLAELQSRFVKMSTDNMEMMTSLQSEQHIAKELAARLGQQEDELKEIREQLFDKDRQLSRLHHSEAEHVVVNHNGLSNEEMEDRVRDFAEKAPLIESLQRELSSAQDAINSLTNQNSILKTQLVQQVAEAQPVIGSQEQVDALSAAVRQLEMERDQLSTQLRESQQLQQALHDKLENIQQDLASQVPATVNGDVITKVQFEALQHAMRQLEEKYTRVMRDKADLTDKAERLEHIILQLQGETDTIGEYVTLYQQQRSAMRRRFEEREGYIYQLARERIDLQTKLGELQALVVQLLRERNMLHTYTRASPGKVVLANHVTPSHKRRRRDRSQLSHNASDIGSSAEADWPDMDGDSSGSETEEPTTAGETASLSGADHDHNHHDHDHHHHHHPHQAAVNGVDSFTDIPLSSSSSHSNTAIASPSSEFFNIPDSSASYTAQKIMHLLDEIGTSNLVERSINSRRFLHCAHCSGRLIDL